MDRPVGMHNSIEVCRGTGAHGLVWPSPASNQLVGASPASDQLVAKRKGWVPPGPASDQPVGGIACAQLPDTSQQAASRRLVHWFGPSNPATACFLGGFLVG